MPTRNFDDFREIVWDYYHDHGRDLPWRRPEPDGSFDPYKIMVSEVMLQQTQAGRVVSKYQEFLTKFPTIQVLSGATLAEVLTVWSGLGYNRRAKFLWQAAQQITGEFPQTIVELSALPGIGVNSAGAIMAYSFNEPVVFIETNIRTVYIHHFFSNRNDVSDTEILELVKLTLPKSEGKEQPETLASPKPRALRKTVGLSQNREWYWALMDYGVYLKAAVGNTSRNSKHYAKQTAFHGSKRQIRGQVLRLLAESPKTLQDLQTTISDDRLTAVLEDLVSEQLIQQTSNLYRL
jgi:A/G-specific adenine glycosylase